MQHEYTTVLACLVKTFPSKKEFRDLVQLTNYTDPESDFFEHMKHIQVSSNPPFCPSTSFCCTLTEVCVLLLRCRSTVVLEP